MDWTPVTRAVEEHLGKTFPAAQVVIHHRGEPSYAQAFGVLDPETRPQAVNGETRFDLASVTKLFTVTALMTFIEAGRIGLDQPVRELVPEFSGLRRIRPYPDPLDVNAEVTVVPETEAQVDAGQVTIRHLLVHNGGLPAWLPLWKIGSRVARRQAVYASDFAYPHGAHVVYSDIGLILLGTALERVASRSLDEIIYERVTGPLGLASITFGPLLCENVAPTEYYAWRGERNCGLVHDENAYHLGGVSGHAGLFGNARDLAVLGDMYLRGGAPLLRPETVREMVRMQAQDGSIRRGLGFQLRSPDPEGGTYPLTDSAYGHTGFTGTSLFVEPTRDLVIACNTNRVYYGRSNTNEMLKFRQALHRSALEVVDRESPARN